MPFDGEPRVVRFHAVAIVFDTDLLLAAELDLNRQPACARIDGVLDELLDDRCRPLDDLAGGDLVREVCGKAMDL